MNENPPVRLNRLAFAAAKKAGAQPDRKLIYVHGLGGSWANWYFQYLLPFRDSFHQVAYDMRGHGNSDCPQSGYAIDDHAGDLHALVTAEADTASRRCFIGYSYGGCVVLEYAARYARAEDHIVMLDAPAVSRIDAAVVADLAGLKAAMRAESGAATGHLAIEFAAMMSEGAVSRRTVSRYATRLERLLTTRFPVEAIDNHVPDVTALEAIACPVLLVYAGRGDSLDHARHLEAHIPDVRLVTIDAGHELVSTHHVDIRALMLEFLQA